VGYSNTPTGGTVFLDEIGDLPLPTQTKLLRVLETREYQRVGLSAPRKTDVRVVAATNRDLREMVDHKEFGKTCSTGCRWSRSGCRAWPSAKRICAS